MCICVIFFFKQKTAYEMRISDWSSDVCSSDLPDEAETEMFGGVDEVEGDEVEGIAADDDGDLDDDEDDDDDDDDDDHDDDDDDDDDEDEDRADYLDDALHLDTNNTDEEQSTRKGRTA